MPLKARKKEARVVRMADHVFGNDEIVRGIINKDPSAAAALYDRFGNKINRLVWRLLGADSEHDDVVQLVFVHILSSIKKLKSSDALEDWITGITVNTVRREIRNRKYRRILIPTADYPETAADPNDTRSKLMVRRLFAILREMRTEDHIVFVLRFVEGNTLGEVAAAGKYSLATAKRRIARAKREFMKRANKDSVLASYIEEMKND